MNTLFLIFISVSFLSFGTHSVLMARHARNLDGLTVTAYRGLSLIILMTPLLFFAPVASIEKSLTLLPTLFFASFFGFIAFAMSMHATKFLSVVVSNVIRQAFFVTTAALLGYFVFSEHLGIMEGVLIALIVLSSMTLSFMRAEKNRKQVKSHFTTGVLLAIGAGVLQSMAFLLFGSLARQTHPFVAGFLWEGLIGIMAFLSLYIITVQKNKTFSLLPWKKIKSITKISVLTVVATVSWGFAILHGKLALASAFTTLSIFVIALLGWIFFKERMSKKQIALLVVVVGLIMSSKILF